MADRPKPFLRKGQGKYTKIDYPVLRRSGVYQPPPDTPPSQQQRLPMQHSQQTRTRSEMSSHSPSRSYSPPRFASHSPPPNSVPPLRFPSETAVMGQRSPVDSDYSRTSDSPPRAKSFGSSLERRMGESDEGVGRDMNSPGFNSGRPRTAGTVDSGFPRDELPPLSPLSSTGDTTRASSIQSIVADLTVFPQQNNQDTDEVFLPHRSPPLSSLSPISPIVAAAPSVPAARAAVEDEEEEEVMVEPAATAAPPAPKRRTMNGDGTPIGNTTEEFERREQQALRRDRRDAVTPPGTYSSISSSTSTITNGVKHDLKELLKHVGEEKGEEPLLRTRRPLESRVGGRGEGLSPVREEMLGGIERSQPQRTNDRRLNGSLSSDHPSSSELSHIGSQRRARSEQEFEGASFRESPESRSESTSHFRMRSFNGEEEYPEAAADESRRRREEREGRESREGRGERRETRQVQQPEMQPVRRRSMDDESDRSNGSSAVARRYLLGDRRPLDEIRSGRSGGDITATQQRPLHHRVRASEATRRHPPPIIIREEEYDSPASSYGREEERVQHMEYQLRDAIAHNDMGEAALRRMKQEMQQTFEGKLRGFADAYAEKEEKMERELKTGREQVDQMRLELEKERQSLRKDETARVKEWRFEEERKGREAAEEKYGEEKKKSATETSKWRVKEEKLKKEKEEAVAKAESSETEKERMRRIIERSQRERATTRGNTALRSAMSRAEDEAASAPVRNGLLRRGGSMSSLPDKENVRPPSSPHPNAFAPPPPQGILKKNQVRWADATFTVEPPEEDIHQVVEVDRGEGEWGPYSVYANRVDVMVTVFRPSCGCLVFKYGNNDLRHITPDGSVVFHYLASTGAMQFDFAKQKCQVFYFADGSMDICRTGKEITKCVSRRGKVERTETIKRKDGSMYAEIWTDNSMAIYDGRLGRSIEQFENGEPLRSGKRATHRHSCFGRSTVGLHLSKNVEFFEPNFYAVYYAETKDFHLYLNYREANEIQYTLRAGKPGGIVHTGQTKQRCITFGRM